MSTPIKEVVEVVEEELEGEDLEIAYLNLFRLLLRKEALEQALKEVDAQIAQAQLELIEEIRACSPDSVIALLTSNDIAPQLIAFLYQDSCVLALSGALREAISKVERQRIIAELQEKSSEGTSLKKCVTALCIRLLAGDFATLKDVILKYAGSLA